MRASLTPVTKFRRGLISSADDMARFEAAISADNCQRATRDLMWTILNPPRQAQPLCLGWSSPKSLAFARGPYGWTAGTDTAFIIVRSAAPAGSASQLDNVNTTTSATKS